MIPSRGKPPSDPRRPARAYEFGIQPHWLSDELLDQLDACRSDEARRLLVYGFDRVKRRVRRPFGFIGRRSRIRPVEEWG
jgi:hypothetical protein